ncbi:MAG: rhodanese-like domain-containing protein [Flavobacteriaceae bacterium]|nr:MAG: rhodanese-like domain-containing protein [Flavobacteriaceae bacterium]
MMKYTKIFLLIALIFTGMTASCGQDKKNQSNGSQENESKISLISASELDKVNDGILLIDVRTPEEFASGHIENSININIGSDDFKEQIAALPKDQEIYLYCKKGGRSNSAAKMIEGMEFKKIYDLKGGITAWEDEGLKTVK